jgi:hypothetical protein
MAMIGASSPLAKYDPSQLSRSDKLMLVGAMLHDTGAALRGGESDSVLNTQALLAQRQQWAMQRGMMGKIATMMTGQAPEYQDGPGPNLVAPPIGPAATSPDFGTGSATAARPAAPAPMSGIGVGGAFGLGTPSGGPQGAGSDPSAGMAAPDASAPPAQPWTFQPPRAIPGTGRAPADLSDPQYRAALGVAAMAGVPGAKELIDLADKSQPHIAFGPNGEAINDKDPGVIGRVFPKVGEGILTRRDAAGNLVGAGAIPGYADAAASIAGATAGAQEAQKSAYDLVDVPMPNGASVKLPRSIALAILAQRATAGGGAGGMGSAGPDAGGGPTTGALGTSQTPGDKALAEELAKLQAARAMGQPKAVATLTDADRTADFSRDTIHDILGETKDPKTGKWVKTKPSQVNWATTGMLGATEEIPGTPAHDLKAKIDTILAQTAVSELQKMRDESPTGGALGRVTQQEINMLAAMRGSIEQTQSGKQLEASLRHHLEQLDKLAAIRDRLYAQQYPGSGDSSAATVSRPTAPPPRAAIEAEMRHRGLLK